MNSRSRTTDLYIKGVESILTTFPDYTPSEKTKLKYQLIDLKRSLITTKTRSPMTLGKIDALNRLIKERW